MEASNKHFFATAVAPEVIRDRADKLIEVTDEQELLTAYRTLAALTELAVDYLQDTMDHGVRAEPSDEPHVEEAVQDEVEAPRMQPTQDDAWEEEEEEEEEEEFEYEGEVIAEAWEEEAETKPEPDENSYPTAPDTSGARDLGERIRRWRMAKGLSTRQLAELADISQPTISQYELGHRVPRRATLQKIAEGLSLELDDLVPNNQHER